MARGEDEDVPWEYKSERCNDSDSQHGRQRIHALHRHDPETMERSSTAILSSSGDPSSPQGRHGLQTDPLAPDLGAFAPGAPLTLALGPI